MALKNEWKVDPEEDKQIEEEQMESFVLDLESFPLLSIGKRTPQ